MKQCFKCARILPRSEFYRHPQMGDGLLGKCKECTKVDVRSNREAKLESYREYDRRRFSEDPARRLATYANSRAVKWRSPEKWRARYELGNAVRDGRVVPQPCQHCGTEEKIHGHHPDYSKPLDVTWLCVSCHFAEHRRLNAIQRGESASV